MSARTDLGKFCWIDLASHDFDADVEWYGELFGWTLGHVDESGPSRYGMLCSGDVIVGGIGEMNDEMKSSNPQHWNNYVAVEDCAAAVEEAKGLGAEVLWDTQEVGGGMGKLAFIKDPAGAVVAFWEGEQGEEPASGTDHGRFCWQELATRDLDAAKTFYSELLGWNLEEMPSPGPSEVFVIKVDGDDIGHMMAMTDEWDGIPPHWSLYFSVDNTDAVCETAKENGGSVLVEPMDIPPGRFARIADPRGGQFYVIKLKDQ